MISTNPPVNTRALAKEFLALRALCSKEVLSPKNSERGLEVCLSQVHLPEGDYAFVGRQEDPHFKNLEYALWAKAPLGQEDKLGWTEKQFLQNDDATEILVEIQGKTGNSSCYLASSDPLLKDIFASDPLGTLAILPPNENWERPRV